MSLRTTSASLTYAAYVSMLIGFIGLGLFVAALAYGSGHAALVAAVSATCFVLSASGFRAGAAKRAQEHAAVGARHKLSIWSTSLQQDQIDRYRATHGAVKRRQTRSNVAEMPAA